MKQLAIYKSIPYVLAISFFTGLFSVTNVSPAHACSCSTDTPFSEASTRADLVVLGKVLSHGNPNTTPHDNNMNLQVLEVLSGSDERTVIRVWGDNGMQCRPYTSQFDNDAIYVMALRRISSIRSYASPLNQTPSSIESPTDYEISICGAYSLQVQGDMAIGNVFGNQPEQPGGEAAQELDRVPLNTIRRLFE
jgi:hypothetical protein